MPTSQPWNPNPNVSEKDRERGYWTKPCYYQWCDEDCPGCNGIGELRTPVPEYRPDKKIRATAWLPHGPITILFWDNRTLDNFREKVRLSDANMHTVRGWDYANYDVRPSMVSAFTRNDPE